MSRNRTKKREYRMQQMAKAATALMDAEDDEDEGTLPDPVPAALGKGLDAPAPALPAPDAWEMFIPITKVDEKLHQVWGRAYQEVRDHTDEKLDWPSSLPEFKKWSDESYRLSNGQSKGNIRAMHQPIAAGKLIDFQMNQAEKAMDIGTEIVDENEWQKCMKGVYTGFSIGGRYKNRWPDPQERGVMRYTPEFNEISIVDRPAIQTAQFKVIKADGSEELRKFEHYQDLAKVEPAAPVGSKQTIVQTPVVMMPALNAPIVMNANAAVANPSLPSVPFITAQNSNVGSIDAHPVAVPTPIVKVEAHRFDKAVQDIPNLRHIQEGELSSCQNCLHFRSFDWEHPYCRKFDSCIQGDWTCDEWENAGAHPDETLVPLESESTASVPEAIALAKPPTEKSEKVLKLEELGARIGIAFRGERQDRDGADYAKLDQYADPANLTYACDKLHAEDAVKAYNFNLFKNNYSPREWAVLGRRITRLAGAACGASFKFDPLHKRISRIETQEQI
jgi:hypothetical protein